MRAIKNLVKLVCLAFLLTNCSRDCGDRGYFAGFYITDKKTGKPYFSVNKDNPDSLRVFENNLSGVSYPISKNFDSKEGYIFGDIDIYDELKDTLYVYLNHLDIDTLVISNKLTRISEKCNEHFFLTTATYNGQSLKTIASDSVGIFIKFNLVK